MIELAIVLLATFILGGIVGAILMASFARPPKRRIHLHREQDAVVRKIR